MIPLSRSALVISKLGGSKALAGAPTIRDRPEKATGRGSLIIEVCGSGVGTENPGQKLRKTQEAVWLIYFWPSCP